MNCSGSALGKLTISISGCKYPKQFCLYLPIRVRLINTIYAIRLPKPIIIKIFNIRYPVDESGLVRIVSHLTPVVPGEQIHSNL
jgi:hypothetical protein